MHPAIGKFDGSPAPSPISNRRKDNQLRVVAGMGLSGLWRVLARYQCHEPYLLLCTGGNGGMY